ncbi:bifunctional 23S rRNA (guanine(2069)-N(7))-methyltransferase RlmK/23S rRNA (guanine(2445)-N(2))-methyltransferase RlmL [Simiduia sp. 21SJ11W-1]|uniref:bifunctional 23S rRNA (guanine(2069)-N(7))-methyltransferase RlmK/23S rRNA (guanine(2445)-N(2))-methyltransferase RlmL n=1 Tax=Simiduia sp. 21SJ11W-1 TaxID=2909669 RepID=UPI00209F2FE3|nr:bifunctional 23S rRNA (guanine(2069)-N(7))-methyltransferase RlmK/23S rRNA (guanine(2445)-N(2))-methyltransferase RlmL [Simiduia sp. 21SJ11W-1]UTA49367.1 bifunctional 23S rRNA (guanine(2069)-N(7))-methyltransferase RlmK/23S rRNA (guanine(2445)-N(2))-methyltransferase RlmL [Simiduia sp. 21SJ11W-1]
MTKYDFFATCPKGLENLLFTELQALGAETLRETVAGVYFTGELSLGYRACLWSRLANKILLPLNQFSVSSDQDLYDGVAAVPWAEHVSPSSTFVVDFSGSSFAIRNTQFGALKTKDAIVDALRTATGERPSIAKQNPDLRVNVRLSRGRATVSLDLSGESLHRRGYRLKQGAAPLKENLAAAVLLRAGWPAVAAKGGALIDPMCGSGTLLIEAALMAADIAPGLLRPRFGFERWLQHQNDLWLSLREEARERKRAGLAKPLPEIRGYDADVHVIRAAEANVLTAKLDHWVRLSRKELKDFTQPTHKQLEAGMVVTNPPYGERLGDADALAYLYRYLGDRMRESFGGWQLAIFTGNPALCHELGMKAHKKYKLYNGTLESELLLFDVHARDEQALAAAREAQSLERRAYVPAEVTLSAGAEMFANRLKKNQKQLAKWLKKESIECYRLYDADMPEYAVAIDVYGPLVHVQEYAAPSSVDERAAKRRFDDIKAAIPVALGVDPADVSYKQRRRNSGSSQYEKLSVRTKREPISVREGQVKLLVDVWQYLDSGLFLDHRPLRLRIASEARNKRFLNLFCYTASASVHAAVAGAKYTLSVDMSRTYLDWARKNFAENGLGEQKNRLEQADCMQWLRTAEGEYDLIMLDPPSFSNSKRMDGVLDVQRDHGQLIDDAMRLLAASGTLYFSNNLRTFVLDESVQARYNVENISPQTLDKDFQRNSKIHQCWKITHRD